MQITIAPHEWRITETVNNQLKTVPNKQGFLSAASISILGKIRQIYSQKNAFDNLKGVKAIAETGYPIGTKRCVLLAECMVKEMVMNKQATIEVRLSIVTQDEYKSLANASTKRG